METSNTFILYISRNSISSNYILKTSKYPNNAMNNKKLFLELLATQTTILMANSRKKSIKTHNWQQFKY